MQNVVFPTSEEALTAPRTPIELAAHPRFGFSFDARFDAARMVCDARFDNDVPSAACRTPRSRARAG